MKPTTFCANCNKPTTTDRALKEKYEKENIKISLGNTIYNTNTTKLFCQSCIINFCVRCEVSGSIVERKNAEKIKNGSDVFFVHKDFLATLPNCKICQTRIVKYRKQENEIYCYSCYKKNFLQCFICNNYYTRTKIYNDFSSNNTSPHFCGAHNILE